MTAFHQETDLIITHLPIAVQINHVLRTYHQLPLWNVFQFSGQPLVADPLVGYWYLPNWLTFIFPYPISFNFLFLVHFFWSGLGLFLFLKKKKVGDNAALFGAICWMGTPKLIGYLAGGQVSTIYAFSWLPWLMIVTQDLRDNLSLRYAIRAAAVLAVISLIDIRWGFFCGLFAGCYLVSNINRTNIKKIILSAILWLSVTIVQTAILILPLIQFMGLSRRAGLNLQDTGLFSIEPSSLFGMFAPQIGINYEQIIYFGIAPIVLVFFAFSKKHLFWIFSALFCLVYSLGANTIFFPLINKVFPFLSWLRVPSRAWFFLVFSMIIMASYGFQQLYITNTSNKLTKITSLIILYVGAFAILFAVGIKIVSGYFPMGILIMAVLTPITLSLVFWTLGDPKKRKIQTIFFFLMVMMDLLIVNQTILKTRPLPEKTHLVDWLEHQPGLFRVYSSSYSLPMPNTLQQANGVNPMHLNIYADFIKSASNYSTGSYSVSLPDVYIDDNTPEDLVLAAQYPDTEMLGLLNVKYLAANFELKSDNLRFVMKDGDQYLYENQAIKERIWYDEGKIDLEKWSPNEIKIRTEGETGTLILSEIYYPGWKAWIDGKRVEIDHEFEILRGIKLDSGSHEVVLMFLPNSFLIGMVISLVGWFSFSCLEISQKIPLIKKGK